MLGMPTRENLAFKMAEIVGDKLIKMFGNVTEGKIKEGELETVSKADETAEETIRNLIMEYFFNDGILSEESEERKGTSGFRWIIDPLDGTNNFLFGMKEWGTLLALEENGQIIFGVCNFPALGEFFYAKKNKGAFLNGRKIYVSKSDRLKGNIFCCDSGVRFAPQKVIMDIEIFITGAGCRLRIYGSGPYSMTRVAVGKAVVAINRTAKPWDIAAPALLVEEAGGFVVDGEGNLWKVDSASILTTNGRVYKEAFAFFQ